MAHATVVRVLCFKLTVLLIPLAAIGLSGCTNATKPSVLTFKSNQTDQQLTQQFGQAYFKRTDGGEYDVVLMDTGITPIRSQSTGPILTSTSAPLSQTVHLRILWRPRHGSRPDAPSATNAIIDWYVQTNDAPAQADRLHYRGAGFVTIDDSGPRARFTIRSALVELTGAAHRLQDPLGSSSLTGSFLATRNDDMVASTMQALRPATPGQPTHASANDGPPPRSPAGP